MIHKLLHTLISSLCIKHLKVKDSKVQGIRKECYCEKCGRQLAFKHKNAVVREGRKYPFVYKDSDVKYWRIFSDAMCEEFRL